MSAIRPTASPANRRSAQRRRGLWVVILVLLLAGGGAGWYFIYGPGSQSANSSSSSQGDAITYTTQVRRGDLSISAGGSGTLIAHQSIDLSFSTSGTVDVVNVKVGDQVTAGQVLAKMGNPETLEAQIASAELQMLQAKKTLDDLQQNANVALAQSYQDWVKAQATYNTALTKAQRMAYARCSQEVTKRYKTQVDQYSDRLTKAENGSDQWISLKGSYDTALANYNNCLSYTEDEKSSAQSTLDVAKAALEQSAATYETLKAASGIDPTLQALAESKVTDAQAKLTEAKENLTGTSLIASIDGRVVYLAASAGAKVGTAKFITIADVSHPTLEISVDESDMDRLAIGYDATVTFDALPDQVFTGKVSQVDPQLTTSGQYRVIKGLVELDSNAAKTIQNVPLGLNASVTIIAQQAKNALLVPISALKDLGNQEYAVFIKDSSGKLKLRPVSVGIMDSTTAEITSGLNDGETISTGTVQASNIATSGSSNSSRNNQTGGESLPMPGDMPPAP